MLHAATRAAGLSWGRFASSCWLRSPDRGRLKAVPSQRSRVCLAPHIQEHLPELLPQLNGHSVLSWGARPSREDKAPDYSMHSPGTTR